MAKRTNQYGALAASTDVGGAERVLAMNAWLCVLGANYLPADGAHLATGCTARVATVCAYNRLRRQLAAIETDNQAVETIGRLADCLKKAGAQGSTARRAGDQATEAIALPAGAAKAGVRAVLLAARTTHRAIGTDQCCLALACCDMVCSQVAATLAQATVGALSLASVAHLVATDRTCADVFCAGACAARPTSAATCFADLFTTGRAWLHATCCADNFLAGGALSRAIITSDMTVAVDCDSCGFLLTCMADGPAQHAIIAVAPYTHEGFVFAVAERNIRRGDRHLQHSIPNKFHLDAQTMVLHFLLNFALQVRFERLTLFTGWIVSVVRFLHLLLVVVRQPVERFVQSGQDLRFVGDTIEISVVDCILTGGLGLRRFSPAAQAGRRQTAGRGWRLA
jgi:hypothetical protein